MIDKKDIDDKIIALIKNDKTIDQGFRLLIKTYQEQVYWTIRKMIKSHEETDDLVQETFIKIYKGIKDFKENSQLFTWIYRIAVNETLGYMRKAKRHQVVELNHAELMKTPVNHYEDSLNGEQIQQALESAIGLLPDKQKAVFNLRYFQEMKYSEMAKILETSEGGLKASYHHAVKKIEMYIKNYEIPSV